MAKSQKKPQPEKDTEKSFLLNRGGQSFDLDDEPAAPAPKPQKRLSDDFVPYRPKGDTSDAPTEYDEFGMYDDEDEEKDSDFWGEDDDMEDDPLYNIANQLLPDRPEINLTINSIDHFDTTCLVAAGVIEEEMRGQMKDELVDQLTAGALLVGAQNFDDVAPELSHKTVSLVDAFMAAVESGTPSAPSFKSLDMQTQRLMVAMMTADLEMLHKGMRDGSVIAPPDYELEMVGSFLADASRSAAAKPTPADIRLMKRAARVFNDVSHALPLEVKLTAKPDGFDLVQKNDAPQEVKPKAQKPKGTPKPPRQ